MVSFLQRFAELCPGVPANFEVISGLPREFAYFKDEIWETFPKARAKDFAKFVAMAKRGHAINLNRSAGAKAEQDFQKSELERSLKYCKEVLKLGTK